MRKYVIYVGLFVMTVSAGVLASDFTYSVPTAGVTPGPTWASQISTALNILKTHTHTGAVTEGPQLGTASIVEDATHQMNDNSITEINGLTYNDSTSSTPANLSLFLSSGNLTYRNSFGNDVRLTVGNYNSVVAELQSSRYMSIWNCVFDDAFVQTNADGSAEYDDTASRTWSMNCPLPSGYSGNTIDSVVVYANTADSNCDIDSASIAKDNPTNSTAPSISNSKTNEAFGTAYAGITFSTDVVLTEGDVAWLYLSPGNDGGGNCDTFLFYGYLITYTTSYGYPGWGAN